MTPDPTPLLDEIQSPSGRRDQSGTRGMRRGDGQRNPARVQRHRCMRALGGMALP